MRRIILAILFVASLSFVSFAKTKEVDDISIVTNLEYENKVEFEATGYAYKSDGTTVALFKKPVKVIVHYNNMYLAGKTRTPITVDEVKLNDDGIPVLNYTVNATKGLENLDTKITVRYDTGGENYTDVETGLDTLVPDGTWSASYEIFDKIDLVDVFRRKEIASIEAWIHEGAEE